MSSQKIRIGIIGAGGWAKYGHIPVLQTLSDFEIIAISSRKKETAEEYAKQFNIKLAFDNAESLITHPEVDLVAVLTPGPEHGRFVKAAIAAGKDVYSEWPLTTNTAESEEILALAEAAGVRHIVGLQRRLSPSARYMKNLVQQGYVGNIRSVRMSVGVNAFQPRMSEKHSWTFDEANFTNVLSIYSAHFCDMLFQAVGYPTQLKAVIENQFPFVTIEETGEKVPYTSPNEVMVIGTLENGGLFSIQLEGAQKHITGLQIDISGTEGVLKITNPRGFENKADNVIEGMNGDSTSLSLLPIPSKYSSLPDSQLDASVQDVAYLYATYAQDKQQGTTHASNFKDAVRQHQLIDQIIKSSKYDKY